MLNRLVYTLLLITSLAPALFAQNLNTAAVDTLTKDVAIAVFANIRQPKAQEIYTQLLNCSDGCDAQSVIRQVGSWDQVGQKLDELALLKSTERFQKMSPAEANTAIRKQLTDFYTRHKAEKPYSEPLSADVQARILAKIDGLLPPAQPEQALGQTAQMATAQPETDPAINEESDISDTALQMSRLERAVKEEQDKRFWTMLISGLVGLLLGAGAVYLLLYRSLKTEVNELHARNSELSRQLDAAQRSKPANGPRPVQNQPDYKRITDAYNAIRAELGDDPIAAIRQLKQQILAAKPAQTGAIRSGELKVESAPAPEPIPEPVPMPAPAPVPAMSQSQSAPPAPVQSEVLYFPPPDPNGLFDGNLQTSALSPASAYCFRIKSDKPDEATFRFEAEPGRVTRFLTYRNYMIEPACDSENSYSSQHTRITNRRDGEAIRENGGWRVKTKALIRYE